MKEVERILASTEISLTRTIQILGKAGQGEVMFGKLRLPIDSDMSDEAKIIFRQILGH